MRQGKQEAIIIICVVDGGKHNIVLLKVIL